MNRLVALLLVVSAAFAAPRVAEMPLPLVLTDGDPLVVFDALVVDRELTLVNIEQVEQALPVRLIARDTLLFAALVSSHNSAALFQIDSTAMMTHEGRLYVRADTLASVLGCKFIPKRKSAGELTGYKLGSLLPTGFKVGECVPGFRLQTPDSQWVTSEELLGDSGLVLAFIRSPDWEPLSRDLLTRLDANREQFAKRGARLAVIHGYERFEAGQWRDSLKVASPLLMDDVGAVMLAYGVYRRPRLPNPAVFVIDKEGIIRWKHLYGEETEPPEMVPVLEAVGMLEE